MKSYKVKGKTDMVLVTARVRTRELEFKSRPHHSLAIWCWVPQSLPIRVPQRHPKIEMAKHLTHLVSWEKREGTIFQDQEHTAERHGQIASGRVNHSRGQVFTTCQLPCVTCLISTPRRHQGRQTTGSDLLGGGSGAEENPGGETQAGSG